MNCCAACKGVFHPDEEQCESGLYGSCHLLCGMCWNDEQYMCDVEGTNDLPGLLETYGPENDFGMCVWWRIEIKPKMV